MRYAIVSDVHANIEALTAVFERVDRIGVDRVLCLGDVVGYHSDPDACIELLRERGAVIILGNHDRAALGLIPYDGFSFQARHAIDWTKKHLSETSRRYLETLPRTVTLPDCFLVHAGLSPEPNDFTRINNLAAARRHLDAFEQGYGVNVCFVGHTHKPMAFERTHGETHALFPQIVSIQEGSRYIFNPGTLGQPRDEDTLASFAIFDATEKTVTWQKVTFDREKQLEKAHRAGALLTDEEVTARLRVKKTLPERMLRKLRRVAGRLRGGRPHR